MKRITLLLLLIPFISLSQIKKQFDFGMYWGYRLGTLTFSANYNLSKKFALSGELMGGGDNGIGIGITGIYYLTPSPKFRPLIGALFTRTLGSATGYGPDNQPTIIKVSDGNYWVPFVGLRFNESGADAITGKSLSVLLRVGYKYAVQIIPSSNYVSGPTLPSRMDKINRYINNGVVGSLGLILNLRAKKAKT